MTHNGRVLDALCAATLLFVAGCLAEEDEVGEDEKGVECPTCVTTLYGGSSEAGGGGFSGGGGSPGGASCFGACGKNCDQCHRNSDGSYTCRTSDYCQAHDSCINAGGTGASNQYWCAAECAYNNSLCSANGLLGYGYGTCRPSASDPYACNRQTNPDGQYCRTA